MSYKKVAEGKWELHQKKSNAGWWLLAIGLFLLWALSNS
jgi:hypothetical protein